MDYFFPIMMILTTIKILYNTNSANKIHFKNSICTFNIYFDVKQGSPS